ncbi:unnamed protein product [Amoebophrya sp. A120]|nr:unnamed protein product [Amoebophrya sp. A120]|eukprot:GSA120T00003497001.1
MTMHSPRCGALLRMLLVLLQYGALASATTITFEAGGAVASSQKSFNFESGTMQEVYDWLCEEADNDKRIGSTKRKSYYMRASIRGQPFLFDHQTGKFYSIRTDLSRTIQSHMSSHLGLSRVVEKWQREGELVRVVVNFDNAREITFQAGGYFASQRSFNFESDTMQKVYNWLCEEADKAMGSNTKRTSYYMRASIAGQDFLLDHQTGKFSSIRTDLSRTIQSHMNSHPGLSRVVEKWQSQGKLAPVMVSFHDIDAMSSP